MYLTSHFFQKRGSPTDPLITLLNIRVMDRTLSPGWDMLLIYIYFLISTILNQKSSMTAKYALKIADILKKKLTFWQPTLDGCQIIDLFVVYQWYIIDFLSLVWQFNFCCRISYFLGILEIKVYAVFCGHSLWELFSNNLI